MQLAREQAYLYEKLEQGCSLEGLYAQVPATGEGDWDPGAAAGQTGCLGPAARENLHCVYVYIYIDVYMYALQQTFILTNQGCEQDEAIGAVCFCASAMCVSLW